MKKQTRALMLFFAGMLLTACAPARTGVVDGTLTTNLRPFISISAEAPFTLADSGRLWVSPETASMMGSVTATFDFAVYTDPAVSPASRFAYAAIIRLEDAGIWNFVPQGNSLPGSFGGVKKVEPFSREGTLYTLCVPSADDWASGLLAANGTSVPERWIAERWVYSLESGSRAMAEYREPWPADMDVPDSDIMLVSEKNTEFLRGFERRALAAFKIDAAAGDFSGAPEAVSDWNQAPFMPDIARLAGEIVRIDPMGGSVVN